MLHRERQRQREREGERERENHLYWNLLRLSFNAAKQSMTLSLKSGMLRTSFRSIESMARALRRSWPMELRRKVFILFKVEKHLSASEVVMGVMIMMFNRATVSENVSCRL